MPRVATPVRIDMVLGSCDCGMAALTTAVESGNSRPAPMPRAIRETTNSMTELAKPTQIETPPKSTIPSSRSRFRPNRSPSGPAIASTIEKERM